jgi:Bcr/CflA subfamily drug resistance transporter
MNSKSMLLFIILLLGCFPQMSSDIYAPSFSMISKSLHADINLVQLSMAIFMVGFAISQLFYGPFSEGYGRRPIFLVGLGITFIGSMINVFSVNIEMLMLGRLIQGLGAGACALFRTLMRDAFHGPEMAKFASYMIIFITFIVPATPTFGAYLSHYLGWRSVFGFLALYNVATLLIIIFVYKETSQHHHLERLKPSFIKKTFKELLTHREFIGNSVAVLITYGAFFSWIVVMPVLLIHRLGISPVTYGWISLFASSSVMGLAGFLNGRLVVKLGVLTLLRAGWFTMLLSSVIMLLGYYLFGLTLLGVVIPMMICLFGSFFIWPNAAMGAFTPFGKIAGYAGAVYGFMQTAGGALVAALVAYLPDNNQLPMAFVVLICSISAWLVYEMLGKPAEELV